MCDCLKITSYSCSKGMLIFCKILVYSCLTKAPSNFKYSFGPYIKVELDRQANCSERNSANIDTFAERWK